MVARGGRNHRGWQPGILARVVDQPRLAHLAWTLATIPVLLGLAASIVRDLLSGRVGVDAVALLSATALLLGESLAGAVIAFMSSYPPGPRRAAPGVSRGL